MCVTKSESKRFFVQRDLVIFRTATPQARSIDGIGECLAGGEQCAGDAYCRTAQQVGVTRFVLISTDKAVNPTNVMGRDKTSTERLCRSYSRGWEYALHHRPFWECAWQQRRRYP